MGHPVRLHYAGVLGLAVASMMGLASPPDADVIQWTAPAVCPDDAALEARIATYVDVAAASAPTQATVRQTTEHFEVELVSTIDGEVQQRTLTAPTCETLAEAVAVVVALTIDPEGKAPPPDDEVVPPEVAAAAIVVRTPMTTMTTRGEREEPPVAPLPGRRPFEIGLRLGGGYGSAVAPVGSGIVGLALSLGRRPWSVEVEGRLWIPRNFDEPDGRYGASVTLGTGAVVGCLRPPTRAVEIPLCFGIEAGSQRAKARGLEDETARNYPWVAPLLRAGLRLRFADTVGLLLLAEGAVPLVKAGIDVGGEPQLWATKAFSFRALAGFDIRWVR